MITANNTINKLKIINIGIIGCGIIGSALKDYIQETNAKCRFSIVDPPKGYNDSLDNVDIIFISIHIPTINQKQDLSLLETIIEKCPNKPIFIRTTILPGTSSYLSNKYNKEVYFMPEFLTERTANANFKTQPMVFTAHTEILKQIFIGKDFIEMTSTEAEIAKYAHNVFGALKVTYFNAINEICNNMKANYDNVKNGFLLSNYIGECHTFVPGPDGQFGYGGKCFPKDIQAFSAWVQNDKFKKLLTTVEDLNAEYRMEVR